MTIFIFSTKHLETHAICSIINKIYSNKRMAPNNKWKFLTPLKFFYISQKFIFTFITHRCNETFKLKIFNLFIEIHL